MPLDPPLQRLFSLRGAGPPPEVPTDHVERRKLANATMMLIHPGPQDGVTVTGHVVPVEGGEIRVRTYRPDGLPVPSPTYFFIHGGGWFQGDLDTAEVECGPMASMVPCFMVSVEYRLAPENKFPTPLNDCVAAYKWMLSGASSLGVDVSRIAIGGTSAGGNLAAALLLVARDEGLQMPIAHMLDVPGLDLTLASSSMDEAGKEFGLTKDAVDEYVGFYADGAVERTHPLVSPLLAPDVSGLPPAVIIVAELDPVRDDGERWVTKLHEAGVPGACFRVQAQIHGGWVIPFTPTSRLVPDLKASALRRAFDGTLVPYVPF